MTLQPGPELDALIAEKVMGWGWYTPGGLSIKGYSNDEELLSPTEPPCSPMGGMSFYLAIIPNYSTGISAAWQLMEKFKWAEPELSYSDEQHCWRLRLSKARNGNEPLIGCDTATHAICLAALKAVGYEFE